ncbi:putative LEA1 protein [Neospora caninum Liverpool]|uniref:LEA1 protein, putative n=1 Tax=Neospora caninum (strain Liverpool) TaxID=572307 RepID=F0VRU7_NEOCL|nr:putative LEA1 protein [Neospora caninum Liverpool]CBZ56445.1 putative LEA1 protein [Neospora caninum Liverpool]CEL71204.1 TPA: LEA1 protein, putative [Neospora caninum Liverpool]|eukprot:XP_003886470.1 putative LEA1 protein [Neospora caninum Liverpool]
MRAFSRYFAAGGNGGLFNTAKEAALDAKSTAKARLTAVTQEATNIAKQIAHPVEAVKDKAKGVGEIVNDTAEALKEKGKKALVDSGLKAREAVSQTPVKDSASSAGRQLKDAMEHVSETAKPEAPKAASSRRGSANPTSAEFKSIGEDAMMYGRELTGQTPQEAAEDVARVARSEAEGKAVDTGKRRSS